MVEGESMTEYEFRGLIAQSCGDARHFAQEVGLTESMVCHMMHSRRKIYEWHIGLFASALNIDEQQLESMLMKGGVGNDSKTGCRYFRIESKNNKKMDTLGIYPCIQAE